MYTAHLSLKTASDIVLTNCYTSTDSSEKDANLETKIALLDDYHNRAHQYADWSSASFAEFQFFSEHHSSDDQLIADLQDFDAIGLMRERTPFPKSVIDQLPT